MTLRKIFTKRNRSEQKGFDRWLFVAVVVLALFGIIMVYNASVPISLRDFGHPYHFIREQVVWLILGLLAMGVISRINYHVWYPLAVPLLLVTLILLVAVFFPVVGVSVLGASRWLNLGIFTIQPSEFAKFSVVLYLSAWLISKEKNRFGAFILFLGLTVGLVLLQPDLGTSIILLCLALSIYLLSGAPFRQLLGFLPVLFLIVLLVSVAAPYRLKRLTTFLNPDADPLGSSYQIRQALIAVGSGGLTGVGLGKSRQKYEYLPEANTDAIFAVIAEEVGFVGSVAVLSVFLFIIWRGFRIAKAAPDLFGRFVAIGITSWFAFQSAINIGAIVSLLPLTGVPLPLISYGGSSLVIILSAFGILLNISRNLPRSHGV